jgi:tRNA G10  N-methylase Trm11
VKECRVVLGKRFFCLAVEEALGLGEVGNCEVVDLGEVSVFKCEDCSVFKRAALAKSVNGERIRKEKPHIERLTRSLDYLTAKLFINLARVKIGDYVWEPFVGAGAVAYEAEKVGAYVVGGDIDIKALVVAKRNLSSDLVQCDATMPVFRRKFDAVVGDPPYGRLSLSTLDIRALLTKFIESALTYIRRGGYLVFASPIYYDFPSLKSCVMYIHGGLYRVVYIVKN